MVLAGEFPPDIRVENEIKALLRAGFGVHIACQTRKALPETDNYAGCVVHRKSTPEIVYKSSIACLDFPLYFGFWRKFVFHLLKKFDYSAIHIHDLPLATVGFHVKKKTGIPFVLDLHENWPVLQKISRHTQTFPGNLFFSEKKWRKYEMQMCQLADKVIVVVDEAKSRLEGLGIESARILVVSNTQDVSELAAIPESTRISKQWPVLFYGGGINEHRGLQIVIKALPQLKEIFPNIKVQIVGNGSFVSNLKTLAIECKVEKQVEFIGYKPFREMLTILAQTDVALIPHVKSDHTDNTIPHKIFQYMHYGIPMLVSNCKPLERIVNETSAGLVYQHDSPIDFAAKLKILIDNYAEWKRKSEQSKQFIISKYNWNIDSGKLIQLYNDLL